MTFLDTLIRAFDGCTGLLEVMTILLDFAAIAVGVRTFRRHQHAAEKLARDPKAHVKKAAWGPVAVLGVLAVLFTALTIYKVSRNV